jgi:hypothetical protein
VYADTWAPGAAPTGWGTLPFGTAYQLVATRAAGAAGLQDVLLAVTDQGLMHAAPPSADFTAVPLTGAPGGVTWATATLLADRAGGPLALGTPTQLLLLACSLAPLSCAVTGSVASPLGAVNGTVVYADPTTQGAYRAVLGCSNGTGVYQLGPRGCNCSVASLSGTTWAAAYSPATNLLALGNDAQLRYYDGASLALARFDWVTNIGQGWGGVTRSQPWRSTATATCSWATPRA